MTMVPTFDREDLPQMMATGPQMDIASAGIAGRALARLGQDGSDFLEQHINQENFDYDSTQIAGSRTKWTSEYFKRTAQAQQSGNYNGFATQFNSDMANDLQQRIANAPTAHAADILRKNFANLQDEFAAKTSVFEGDGHKAVWTGNTQTNLAQMRTIPYRDPSQADSVYAEGLGIIQGGAAAGLNQGDVAKMGESWKNEVYGGVAQHYLEANPQGLATALRAGQYDKYLSEPQLIELQSRADEAVKRQQAEAQRQANENAVMMRGSVDSAFQDNLASISDTGKPAVPLSRAQLQAAYPKNPERVEGMLASLDQAQKGYVATQHVAFSSPTDDDALLQSLTPKGAGYTEQAGTYNTVLKAVQQKQVALAKDPAAYVQAASPQVRSLFQAALQDPSKIPAAVAAQDAAYDHLGVPPDQRPVLSAGQAAGVVRQIASADPSKMDVGAQLDQMAKDYGDAWPRVYADLVKAKMPPSYEVLATMDAPEQLPGRQDMQRALALAAQKGGPQALEELAPKDASIAIKAGLPDALSAFRQTAVIPGAVSNVGLLSKVSNAVSTLAHFYAIQGQDGATALLNARDAVLDDKYDFSGTMRVPKGMLPQVNAATTQLLAATKPEDLRASAGMPPDIASDRWASVRQNSSWFPTQNDDGVMLMVQSRDGRWSRVLRADGSPVQVKFSDLSKTPAPAASGVQPDDVLPSGP